MYDYNSTHFDLFDNCFLPVTYKHFGILMNLHQQIIQYVNQTLISSGSTYTALACQNSHYVDYAQIMTRRTCTRAD